MTAAAAQKLRQVFGENVRAAMFNESRVDRTIQRVFIGTTEDNPEAMARRDAEKAIKAGHAVTWPDGTREWINTTQDWVDGDYVWHEDGDRVRCTRTRVHVAPDGTRTERKLRKVWRQFE